MAERRRRLSTLATAPPSAEIITIDSVDAVGGVTLDHGTGLVVEIGKLTGVAVHEPAGAAGGVEQSLSARIRHLADPDQQRRCEC